MRCDKCGRAIPAQGARLAFDGRDYCERTDCWLPLVIHEARRTGVVPANSDGGASAEAEEARQSSLADAGA